MPLADASGGGRLVQLFTAPFAAQFHDLQMMNFTSIQVLPAGVPGGGVTPDKAAGYGNHHATG